MRPLSILIVIPAHNHGTTLPAVVHAAMATGYDLLVIDDGSKDDTLQSIAGCQCRTVRFKNHRGKGAVLLEGAKQAANLGHDTLISIDADARCNPADIHYLVEKAQTSQIPCVVLGARHGFQDDAAKPTPLRKTSVNFWVRLECGLEVPDIESTLRLYPVKELLAQNFTPGRYGFTIESLVKLAWSGIPVSSVPVSALRDPSQKQDTLANTLRLAFLHSRLVLRRLLPWPHQKLIEQEPLPKKIYATLTQNPLKVLGQSCREHTSPFWLATAVWLGIFMGALPLLTIHTIAIIYVAHRLHLNKVAAVAASQFCMPPVVPVLCIQMGYYLRKGDLLLDFSWQPWLLGIHERLWEWLIGSLLVGPLLGLIGAIAMYLTAARLQNYKLRGIE